MLGIAPRIDAVKSTEPNARNSSGEQKTIPTRRRCWCTVRACIATPRNFWRSPQPPQSTWCTFFFWGHGCRGLARPRLSMAPQHRLSWLTARQKWGSSSCRDKKKSWSPPRLEAVKIERRTLPKIGATASGLDRHLIHRRPLHANMAGNANGTGDGPWIKQDQGQLKNEAELKGNSCRLP